MSDDVLEGVLSRLSRLEMTVEMMAIDEAAGGGNGAGQGMPAMVDNTPFVYVNDTGWHNCRVQMGYNKMMRDEDITGRGSTGDGTYYIECDLKEETVEVKKCSGDSVPDNDYENHKINIKIGVVSNGEMMETIGCMPVLYKYV